MMCQATATIILRYPGVTITGAQLTCADDAGHDGDHYEPQRAMYWPDWIEEEEALD